MSKEHTFLIFMLEYYRNKKNLSGKEIIDLFDRYQIWDLAKKSYYRWHIESPDNFIQEIDHHLLAGA
ncbi:MAG: DUF3791 domain-containing protein [Bacteroidales bacterium]|jgi:hypothetical protein|nr:DUF3791 domain-containing protein [Bacteroidales bacterium]